jgi:hypothetical protein
MPVTNGFRWRFMPASELLNALFKTIDMERQCCRFLQFSVTVEPDAGPVWLEVTGPPGTTQFLEEITRI